MFKLDEQPDPLKDSVAVAAGNKWQMITHLHIEQHLQRLANMHV